MTTYSCTINKVQVTDPSTTEEMARQAAADVQSWCGRGISAVQSGISATGNSLHFLSQKIFKGLNILTTNNAATASVFRKLDQHALKFFEFLSHSRGRFSELAVCIRRNVAIIDFFQIVSDIHYFVNGKFKEIKNEQGQIKKARDSELFIGGRLAFFVADIGGALLWLQEMGFVSLSNAASVIGEARIFSFAPKVIATIPMIRDVAVFQKASRAIGEFRVFSFIKNCSCLSVTLRAIDLAYALLAVDAARKLLNATNNAQIVSASLEISSYVSELVLSAIIFAGVTNVVTLGVAGVTCITLALSSFFYNVIEETKIKQAPELLLKS